jgi:NAD(P)-dependent dehydrogenase (short-subunit alcohol dehydrogenase family)
MDLTDKVAVVTGTANPRGIGVALCRGYGSAGARLVLGDIDAANLRQRVDELRADGFDAAGLPVDMASAESVEHFADDAFSAFGRVDVLHLNHVAPSGLPGQGLLDPETEAWETAVNVNLLGVLRAVKAFVPRMIRSDEWGYVLATVSGAGVNGLMYGVAPYAVTKSAITALMECLHGQLRDAGSKIRCGVVVPGVVATQPGSTTNDIAGMLRQYGFPATLSEPDEVARFTLEAMAAGRFWAYPDVDDDARLTGGRHRESIEWANAIYRAKADAITNRDGPDAYLWGPPAYG